MKKNKKAVSLMVSYTILIVIAIAISIITYSYLKLSLPSEKTECSQDIHLIVEEINCSNGELNITLSNRGLFSVPAIFLKFGNASRQVRQQINKNNEILTSPIKPGEKWDNGGVLFDVSNIVIIEGNYLLEIEPAILEKRDIILCNNALVTQEVQCTIN